MAWFLPLLIGIALSVVATLLMPKPKQPKPEAAKDLESPTADASRPVAVIFGTITVNDPNILWSGDKARRTYQVKV